MFDWPMSSPQMMQMFGFLPVASALACTKRLWAATASQQPVAGPHGTGSGTAGRPVEAAASGPEPSRPEAAAQPAKAPTTTKAAETRCERLIMPVPFRTRRDPRADAARVPPRWNGYGRREGGTNGIASAIQYWQPPSKSGTRCRARPPHSGREPRAGPPRSKAQLADFDQVVAFFAGWRAVAGPAAGPGGLVGVIARGYGCSHLGNFAAAYARMFGDPLADRARDGGRRRVGDGDGAAAIFSCPRRERPWPRARRNRARRGSAGSAPASWAAGCASTLMTKGYAATVYNRSQDKAQPLLDAGAALRRHAEGGGRAVRRGVRHRRLPEGRARGVPRRRRGAGRQQGRARSWWT